MTEISERYGEGTRRVLALAQEEARTFNHPYIGTEHIVLGLLREGKGTAARVLAELGVTENDLRASVEQAVGRGSIPVQGEVDMTPRTEKVVQLSVEEANRFGISSNDTGHLLLALIDDGGGIAGDLFQNLGVNMGEVRVRVTEALAESHHT